jgi:hypothetical protein
MKEKKFNDGYSIEHKNEESYVIAITKHYVDHNKT